MKKILLATTALVSLVAASAHADAPTVSVGGSFDFQAGFTDQKSDYRTPDVSTGDNGLAGNSRDAKFSNDTRINIKAQGKADNGLTYGAVVDLLADISNSNDNAGANADRTYLFVESGYGRVEAGGNVGPARTLKVDASTFARATGGIAGDWYRYVNLTQASTTGVNNPNPYANYIITPDLPLDGTAAQDGAASGLEDASAATKITYYTPKVSGLQGGVSYIPDSGNRGTAAAFSGSHDERQFRDVFDFGVKYDNQFNQFGVAASATSQLGTAEVSSEGDLRSYALGLDVTYAGFTFGGSWGDLGKSGLDKLGTTATLNSGATAVVTGNDSTQSYWTLGGAYVQGPVGVSVTYLNSRRDTQDTGLGNAGTDKFNNLSVGADYQLAPGLLPYAEVSFFDLEPGAGVPSNSGEVFILGTKVNF